MSAVPQLTLDEALRLVRRLPPHDRAALIIHLVAELAVHADVVSPPTAPFALPVIDGGTWVEDLPLRRRDLYDDDERC